MKSYTIAEIKGQMEEIARRVTEEGEHIRLVLEDGRSADAQRPLRKADDFRGSNATR